MKFHKTSFDLDEGLLGDKFCNAATAAMAAVGAISASQQADAASSAAAGQANAARNASDNSLKATRETNALNWQLYQSQLAQQSPYTQEGQQALAALGKGFGFAPSTAVAPPGSPQALTSLGGVVSPTNPTGAGTFTNAAGQLVDAQGNEVARPYAAENYNATQGQLDAAAGTVGAGEFNKRFSPSDLTTDPSYQWRLEQGLKALQNSAAARGKLLTGQGANAITDYAQGAASQEYQNAYDRFNANQDRSVGRLMSLAGIGQNATNQTTAATGNTASNITSNTQAGVNAANNFNTQAANANAAGTIGSANAWAGALNNGANNWLSLQYLNNLPKKP